MSLPGLLTRATAEVAARCRIRRPTAALVLGSGLGALARSIEGATLIPFDAIPGFPATSIRGHAGELVHGMVDGHEVLALSGRIHLYEGHAASIVAFPVRVVQALGARTLFVSNAAGAIRPGIEPGTLMIARDHINATARHPLIGSGTLRDYRSPVGRSLAHDDALGATFVAAATAVGLTVTTGVYAGVLGPSYETPAEVRMLARMGADAVGMSTIVEVLMAQALGMRVVAVSCLTNPAAGITGQRLSHAEVLAVATRIGPAFEEALRRWVSDLD